jgi:amidohydrolase
MTLTADNGYLEEALQLRDYLVETRRQIHQHPELSFQEEQTAAFVAQELRHAGYEVEESVGGFGVRAVLRGQEDGRTIALRADMDALPIEEENDLPFRSQHPGVMHACGHDAHTAMLLTAAKAMQSRARPKAGNVVFLFQPAEEMPPGGAQAMIAAGVLDDPRVDAVFGLHQGVAFDTGKMAIVSGPRSASSDSFHITVLGKGGHAAMPHRTVDPIAVTGLLISALQQIVSRHITPMQPAVLTIGSVHGGTKENVIPDEVSLAGTVRTFDPAVRRDIPRRIDTIVKGITAAHGATYRFDYSLGYPVLVNDPEMAAVARCAAERVFGAANVVSSEPAMAAEDFSYYLQRAPGAFCSLGVGTPGSSDRPSSHSPRFQLNEAGLPYGVAFYLSLVDHYLNGAS